MLSEHETRRLAGQCNCYSDVESIVRQVMTTTAEHRELIPKVESYTGARTNFQPQNLICLNGTIRVTYKSAMYHIPIAIYLPPTFPAQEPECFIKPTHTMSIRRTKNVDQEALSSWRRDRGPQLNNCVKSLQSAFGEAPPVVAKTQTHVAGPPSNSYTPPATQNLPYPTGNSPYPVGNASINPYPVHNAYPPVHNAHQPYMPNPMAHRPSMNQNAVPSYPGSQGNNLPPYPGTNLPSYPGTNTPPYNQPARPTQAPQRPQTQPSVDQSLLIDSQKEYQIERINNYLVAQGDELMKNTSDEISTLEQTKNGLKGRETSLNQHFESMRTEKVDLETKIAQLESIISVKQEEVNKMSKNIDEGINPDEIIQASTPLERQILKCHSEDLAISDAVYYLNSALQRDLLDVDQFLREVRKLGRKQFQLRAMIRKARQVGGLSSM